MRKLEVCRKVLNYGSDAQRTLVYYILVDILGEEEDGSELENYGVSILIDEISEEASIRAITMSQVKISRLADLLASNLVTPVSLEEVICDWLS